MREGISNHTFNDLEQDQGANSPAANIKSDFFKIYYKYHKIPSWNFQFVASLCLGFIDGYIDVDDKWMLGPF